MILNLTCSMRHCLVFSLNPTLLATQADWHSPSLQPPHLAGCTGTHLPETLRDYYCQQISWCFTFSAPVCSLSSTAGALQWGTSGLHLDTISAQELITQTRVSGVIGSSWSLSTLVIELTLLLHWDEISWIQVMVRLWLYWSLLILTWNTIGGVVVPERSTLRSVLQTLESSLGGPAAQDTLTTVWPLGLPMLAPALAHDVGISVTARLAIMKHAQGVANLMGKYCLMEGPVIFQHNGEDSNATKPVRVAYTGFFSGALGLFLPYHTSFRYNKYSDVNIMPVR